MRLLAAILLAALFTGCTTVTVHVYDSTIVTGVTGNFPRGAARDGEVR